MVTLIWLVKTTGKNSKHVFKLGKSDEISIPALFGQLPGIETVGSGTSVCYRFTPETYRKIEELKSVD